MCGIAGLWFSSSQSEERLSSATRPMASAIAHRGPDSEGSWVDNSRKLLLVHRRLSILDLSQTGNQPMHSQCGRYTVIYNGECYNFAEVRDRLLQEGSRFIGRSDTEVLVEGCARWGVQKTLRALNGMFAFALWDASERSLFLARDPTGIKPLYYGWAGDTFLFASELKALRAWPHFNAEVNRNSLGLFLKYGYIPAPHSIYRNIFKLPPGHFLALDRPDRRTVASVYWSAWDAMQPDRSWEGTNVSDKVTELDALLRDAMRKQMVADVPVGAFLSGGVDSSTVVALMQQQSRKPVKTFTIGFEEGAYNEADQARSIARHLGTDHTELFLSSRNALDVIPKLPAMLDEPMADPSAIPTYLVAQLARRHVTVSLSGDGGDELFMGYNHCLPAWRRTKRIQRVPHPLRTLGSLALRTLSNARLNPALYSAATLSRREPATSSYKLQKYADVLEQTSAHGIYRTMASQWFRPEDIVQDLPPINDDCDAILRPHDNDDALLAVTHWDMANYLPEDVLTKLDRVSMAVGLEARVPLLDQRVVSYALGLPDSLKVVNGQRKWLLRQVLSKYVPPSLTEIPKQGFSVPIAQWLRGPLRPWAEELLSHDRLERHGYLRSAPVRKKWLEHLGAQHNWEELLWSVLTFQMWAEEWL